MSADFDIRSSEDSTMTHGCMEMTEEGLHRIVVALYTRF